MSVYKSEKPEYLERSLQSIWDDQICKPNKIILVQDGPIGIDLTEVLDRWIAKLGDIITLIVNEVNIGLTKSLNKGITAIDTDYIARMDSDDVSRPDRFAVQSEFLDTHKDVAVIGLPDHRLGEKTAAIIEIKDDVTCTKEEIEDFCMELPRYKRPKEIIFADIPRNATGKIEKPKLRKMYGADRLVEQENKG